MLEATQDVSLSLQSVLAALVFPLPLLLESLHLPSVHLKSLQKFNHPFDLHLDVLLELHHLLSHQSHLLHPFEHH